MYRYILYLYFNCSRKPTCTFFHGQARVTYRVTYQTMTYTITRASEERGNPWVFPMIYCVLNVELFRVQRQLKAVANNEYSCETARNELSHMKYELFATRTFIFYRISSGRNIEWSNKQYGRVDFVKFINERVKHKTLI